MIESFRVVSNCLLEEMTLRLKSQGQRPGSSSKLVLSKELRRVSAAGTQGERGERRGGQMALPERQGQTTRAPAGQVTKNPNLTLAGLKAQKKGTRMVQEVQSDGKQGSAGN